MRNLAAIILSVLFLSLATVSFAEVGIQFKVPYQGTANDGDLKTGASGTSTLLTFDLDAGTTVGILNENINFTDTGGAADVTGDYTVNAIRVTKAVVDPVYVGIDLGGASGDVKGTVGDVLGGVKLLSSKGKITSFLNVELLYRLMRVDAPIAGGVADDFGGVFLSVGAGVTF